MEVVAVTGPGMRWASFRPYVPCVGECGTVWFQATILDGGSVVTDGRRACGTGVTSHPEVGGGRLSFFTSDGLWLDDVGVARDVGPLGPTANDAGTVAFRSGGGVSLFVEGEVIRVTDEEVQGLPLACNDGSVVFRSNRGLSRWTARGEETLIENQNLGNFPSVDRRNRIGFVDETGPAIWDAGTVGRIDVPNEFASWRGFLIAECGRHLVLGTPIGGTLGIYELDWTRVFGIGDPFRGSTIEEFALNPVSLNNQGKAASRIAMADGTEAIVTF